MKSLGFLLPALVFPLLARAQPATPARPTPAPSPIATPATPAVPAATPAATPAPAPAAIVNPAAPTGPRLSMDAAVAHALDIQPAIAASNASAASASARIDEARAAIKPTLSASASASISTHTPFQSSSSGTGAGTTGGDPTVAGDLGARAAWLLTDFGKTGAKIRSAEASYQAAKLGTATTGLDVRTGVETAYLQAVAARELAAVAVAAEATAKRHLDEAHRFVLAGATDPITEATAAATAASETAARVQAEGNYRTAIVQLRLAIGDPSMPDDIALDAGWPQAIPGEDQERLALLQQALDHRPELAGARATVEAADASLTATSYGKRPTISAGASFDWPVNNHTTPDPVWTASLTLSVPIFDGGLVAAQTREAEAQKTIALANQRSEQLAIEHDVESAWISIKSATATLESSSFAVDTAHKQLALAEGRFAQGVGSAVELADAQNAVTNAEGQKVSAEFQLASARTDLRRALGQ